MINSVFLKEIKVGDYLYLKILDTTCKIDKPVNQKFIDDDSERFATTDEIKDYDKRYKLFVSKCNEWRKQGII